MSPRPSFILFLFVLIVSLAGMVAAQAPPAATPGSTADPNTLTNKSIIEMVAAKLPEEVIITKTQTRRRTSTYFRAG